MFVFTLLTLIFLICSPLNAVEWEAVLESDLSIDQPKIDPEADAEAIFWKVWITDHMLGGQQPQTIKEQSLRIKVFTDRGVEDHSTIDLVSSTGETRIADLRARTIKPDGRIIELEKKSIFERTVARGSGLNVKMRAFSMPGVEPGDIVEYQWKESRDNHFAQYSRLYVQQNIPTWEVSYHVKPSTYAYEKLGYSMKNQSFNVEHGRFEKLPSGFYRITNRDIPAFKREPRMPPEDHVRSWILLFYTKGRKVDPQKYWQDLGKAIHQEIRNELKVDGNVKKKMAELTASLASPQEKLNAIFEFCLNNLKSIYHDRFGMTAEERQDFKPNKKPSDTLKQGMGSSRDINMLFVALLNAAGIEAHWALCAGRDDAFFNPGFMDPYFLDRSHIAVKIGDNWNFFDLSSPYLEPGMLRWAEEGVQSLILDSKNSTFQQTPFSDADKNRITRKANLKLLEDGTVEGTIERTCHGHYGVTRKALYDGVTEKERMDDIEEIVQNRLSTAEVNDVEVENVTAVSEPCKIRYRVRVPGYAQRTSKRLFLQPAFFRMNIDAPFQTSERKHDVYFSYPWSENDEIVIELPEGFELAPFRQPNSAKFQEVGAYQVKLEFIEGKRQLVYTRKFSFGKGGRILFPAQSYPSIKQAFDLVHEQDNHVVTLTRKVEAD